MQPIAKLPTRSISPQICKAQKKTSLGTYECDIYVGHISDHTDLAQHHSWPDSESVGHKRPSLWQKFKLIAACAVMGYALVVVAFYFGGAR